MLFINCPQTLSLQVSAQEKCDIRTRSCVSKDCRLLPIPMGQPPGSNTLSGLSEQLHSALTAASH